MLRYTPVFTLIISVLLTHLAGRPANAAPDPAAMLSGPWLPGDPHAIDFDALPHLSSGHAVISDVRGHGKDGGVNQHNYLAHHEGRFWAMWSDGPGVEDRVGQIVKYATSGDGLNWSEPRPLTPEPPGSGPGSPHYGTRSEKGFRYIARGFWKRGDDFLALASLDEAAGFFGPSLELHAFRWSPQRDRWEEAGLVCKDAINNFPPLRLPSGEWMMSRRAHDYKSSGVSFLRGGVEGLDRWESFPVLGSASELKAEEPDWWILPDDRLAAVFRDNRRGGYLYRSISDDGGATWSVPLKTNFPDATSKVCGLRLGDGSYVLVSNSNPRKRDPLTLAWSGDGLVFTKLFHLVGGRQVDYPHVIEHDGNLFIAFSGGKQSVEVLKVKLADLAAAKMPETPVTRGPNEGETVVDGDVKQNDAMAPVRDVPGLPRVLLIGDSISIGYTLDVRKRLAGKANVHRIPQNGGATEVGLDKIDAWLGGKPWDVIHFNFGLHDAKYVSETGQRASREQYVANLRTLVSRMKQTGAKLIFATTTPVPDGGVLSPTRRFDSVEERNKLAIALMAEEGVAIDDLYAVVAADMEKLRRPKDLHFNAEGYKRLGKAVAASVENTLGR